MFSYFLIKKVFDLHPSIKFLFIISHSIQKLLVHFNPWYPSKFDTVFSCLYSIREKLKHVLTYSAYTVLIMNSRSWNQSLNYSITGHPSISTLVRTPKLSTDFLYGTFSIPYATYFHFSS
ncbi:hypothetical protein PGB90_007172 [Kerria lacca]